MMAQKKVSPRDLKYVESLEDVVVVKDAASSTDVLIEYPDTAELQYLLGIGFTDFKWSCDSAEDKVYDLVQKEEDDFTVELFDEDFLVLEDEGVESFIASREILDAEKFVEGVNALCKEAVMAYVERRTSVEIYDNYSLDFDYDSETGEVSGRVCEYTYDDYRFDRRKEERYGL